MSADLASDSPCCSHAGIAMSLVGSRLSREYCSPSASHSQNLSSFDYSICIIVPSRIFNTCVSAPERAYIQGYEVTHSSLRQPLITQPPYAIDPKVLAQSAASVRQRTVRD